jgi:hypothetical protein
LGKDTTEPFDRVRQAAAALEITGLQRQLWKQMREPLRRDGQELAVGADVHHLLRDAERDDLRVGHPATGVLCAFGQEIVSGAEHRNERQVEVGEHRGPLPGRLRDKAPPTSTCTPQPPSKTPTTVESII